MKTKPYVNMVKLMSAILVYLLLPSELRHTNLAQKLKIKAKHSFNIGFQQHSTFLKYKIGEKRTVSKCKSKVSICTLPDRLSLKVVWGMLYSFAAFLTGILFSMH